ncbi:MAG: dephospho-CoA kinase [Bifidobacteriaceae bacterium]|jgi:dephospho-CoA kinase|nr:dephospho-CoA kinase [Bifidobacteriaceae bacterium]
MLRVALTGGLAAGKSTVSAHLRRLGFPVADADRLAREAVAPGTQGLAAVAELFGPGVLTTAGELDRAALARLVFADPAARRRLESVVHPLVRSAGAKLAEAARAAGAKAVIFDIPLLVETGQAGDFDLVVSVAAPEELRTARALARGLTPEQVRGRLAAQASEAERAAAADIVLDGSGTVAGLEAQVESVLVPAIACSRVRPNAG